MSDVPDRLTILEMEYALVSARLGTIDARLTLVEQRLTRMDATVATKAQVADLSDRFDAFAAEVRRALGLSE